MQASNNIRGASAMTSKEALDILNRFVFDKLDFFRDSKEIKSIVILEHAVNRLEQLEKENQDLKTKLKKEGK